MSILRGGVAIVKHTPDSAGGFSIATPPAASVGTKVRYAPNFVAGPGGKCPYRRWTKVELDGIVFFANGHDQPWYWDREAAAFYDMGSAVPTTFAGVADTGGSTHAAGTVFVYRCEFFNSRTGKATASQELTVTHASLTFDVDFTWTDPVGEWDYARIYRRRQGDEIFALVAQVAIATAAYTDATSESTLETATAAVRRYRETKPPIFKGVAGHLGRLWGWTGLDAKLYYSQSVRIDSEFVLDDFPTANVVQIGPEDGLGEIVAVISHFSFLYIFKRRGVYELSGDNAGNFDLRQIYAERGALSQKSLTPVQSEFVFVDEQGLMRWSPGGEMRFASAAPGTNKSAIAPIWRRINRSCADMVRTIYHEAEGEVEVHLPLDHSPIPNCRVIWDTRLDRFTSVEYGVFMTDAAYVDDTSGVEHLCRGDDLGFLWEEYIGNAEGAYDGDTTASLTAASQILLTASAAAFGTTELTGPDGTPLDIYDASGNVAGENRVYDSTATTLTPLFPAPAATDSSYSVAVGVIPAVWRLGWLNLGQSRTKVVPRIYLKSEPQSSASTLRVDSAIDGGTYSLASELDLTDVRLVKCPTNDRADVWSMQATQRYAGMDFAISLVEIQYRVAGVT